MISDMDIDRCLSPERKEEDVRSELGLSITVGGTVEGHP